MPKVEMEMFSPEAPALRIVSPIVSVALSELLSFKIKMPPPKVGPPSCHSRCCW